MTTQIATRSTDIIDHGVYRLKHLFGEKLTANLREESHMLEETEVDGILEIDGTPVPFIVKNELTLGQLKQFHKRNLKNLPDTILVLGYSDEPQRTYCREHDINFLDQAGNCFINLSGLRMIVDGVSNDQVSRTASRAFQKSGLKLLYAFSRVPDLLQHPFENIARSVGIAKGTVGEAMTDLRKDGFLTDHDGQRILTNGRKLVEKWAYAYLTTLRPTLHRGFFHYLGDYIIKDISERDGKDQVHHSGSRAADRRGNYLKGFDTILYTDLRLPELREKLQLVPVGKKPVGETIEVLSAIEPENVIPMDYDHMVGDLILYADLINTDDPRVLEAAEKLLNHEIRDRFLQNGFRW